MTRNKTLFFTICAVLAFLSLINIWLAGVLRDDSPRPTSRARVAAAVSRATRAAEPSPSGVGRYPLIPDNPADYGIITIDENQMPHEQMEWNAFMQQAIVRSGVLETASGNKALAEMGTSPAKFDDTMRRVDEEIAGFEQQQRDRPDDPYPAQRLQALYQLKALGKALKDKVAVRALPQDLPVPAHLPENPPGDAASSPLPAPESPGVDQDPL